MYQNIQRAGFFRYYFCLSCTQINIQLAHTNINQCLKSQHSLNSIFMQRIFNSHYDRPFDCCMIPKWFSYSGEGSSLSFHIPPVFQGLLIWAVCSGVGYQEYKAIIKNKRKGIPLFEATHARPYFRGRWLSVRGLGAGRANEGTLPRIRQRWTAAETNSAGSVQGSVQVFELATWHGRGA